MSAPGRNEQRSRDCGSELGSVVPQVARGVASQVQGHIVNPTANALHDLVLAGRRQLEMHAAQGSAPRSDGQTRLNDGARQMRGSGLALAPESPKSTPLIHVGSELDYKDPGDRRRRELH
jgi:hypothetical protein